MMHAHTTTPARAHAERRSMRHRIGVVALSIALATTGATPAFAETPATDGFPAEYISGNATPSAAASLDRALTTRTYQYKYVNVKRTYYWTNRTKELGVCKIDRGAGGGTCTISASYTVKASVGLEFGLSKQVVSAGINVNGETSVSGTVSWTSPKAPVGSIYKARAVGTRVTYKIQKWKVTKAGGRTARSLVSTSATLSAFIPVKGFAIGQ